MSYWSDRQKQAYQAMEKDETALKKRLSRYYDVEWKRLEKDIQAFYSQYGTNNVIEYRKLLEKLSPADVELLIENIDAFVEKYPQYAHLAPVRENIYKLNRLEGLQQSITLYQLEIGAKNNAEITAYLTKQALRGLNISAEVLGTALYSENSEIIKQFVDIPWSDGKNFSTRIWENSNKLSNYLNTDLAQGFARGDSYETLVKRLRQRFEKVTRNDAYRLVYTEGTFVMAESSMQAFKQDFEKYKLSPIRDEKLCPICRGVASTPFFYIEDRQPGVNFPPIHPWCRCSFEIVVDDWDEWLENYVRTHSSEQAEDIRSKLK